jgi:hypothetical protein
VLWPIFIQTLKHFSLTAVSSTSKVENQEYIGMICLLVAVLNSSSQFYALVLIDEPVNFVSSVISAALSELVGSWILLLRITGGSARPALWNLTRRMTSSKARPAVAPLSLALVTKNAQPSVLLGFAIKLAHEEVGEKLAIVLGGAVAAYVRTDLSWRLAIAKIAAIALVECATDEAKATTFRSAGIHVHAVGYHLRFRIIAAVLLMSTTAVNCTLAAVRFQCLWTSG